MTLNSLVKFILNDRLSTKDIRSRSILVELHYIVVYISLCIFSFYYLLIFFEVTHQRSIVLETCSRLPKLWLKSFSSPTSICVQIGLANLTSHVWHQELALSMRSTTELWLKYAQRLRQLNTGPLLHGMSLPLMSLAPMPS